VNQEEREHNEVDGMKKGVDSTEYVKERLVICNEENTKYGWLSSAVPEATEAVASAKIDVVQLKRLVIVYKISL